jgi:hypothetical protein
MGKPVAECFRDHSYHRMPGPSSVGKFWFDGVSAASVEWARDVGQWHEQQNIKLGLWSD